MFIRIPEVVELPNNATVFTLTNDKAFVLKDLIDNGIEHNLNDHGRNVTPVDVNSLPVFVQVFHNEMHQKRYINTTLSASDNVYSSMLAQIQQHLGERFNEYFENQPPDADNGRVVDLLELDNYFYLFKDFANIDVSIQGKTELCKCAALHSHIVDRAIRAGARNGSYNRDAPWTSKQGNLAVFKIPGTSNFCKYDAKFDLRLFWGRELEYPALLLEEKPDFYDSGCADDRMQLAIMSKAACSCMTMDIGSNAIVMAVFVCGTRYEIYYGFFGEGDDKNFYFRCVSIKALRSNIDAFDQAFLFYNLAHRRKPDSIYDNNEREKIMQEWSIAAEKRKRIPTLSSLGKSSKKRKTEQSENKTNVEMEDVQVLQQHGYDVNDPVDFDAVNVIVPLNWSPNVIQGVRASDKVPIVAKLATDSEIEIVDILSKSAELYIVKPLDIIRRGSRKFLVMERHQTAANITVPNASWWWKFALALLKAVSMLHQANVTHNDIKPDHIALSNEGDANHVLLLDFDASEKHSGQDVRVQGIVGTKGWMAPEVERNQGPYNPFKADMWSVGAVLESKAKDFKSDEMKIPSLIGWLKATDPAKRPLTLVEAFKTYNAARQFERDHQRKMKLSTKNTKKSTAPHIGSLQLKS